MTLLLEVMTYWMLMVYLRNPAQLLSDLLEQLQAEAAEINAEVGSQSDYLADFGLPRGCSAGRWWVFILETMDFALKMMGFVLETMNLRWKWWVLY